jgi:hypothetical protein
MERLVVAHFASFKQDSVLCMVPVVWYTPPGSGANRLFCASEN